MSGVSEYQTNGLLISPLRDLGLLAEMRHLVLGFFSGAVQDYIRMSSMHYHELVAECQDRLNELAIVERLVRSEADQLRPILGDDISAQSFAYLRASRPVVDPEQEYVGWHRETFYGPPYMAEAINFWLPIENVDETNSLRYVPGSHLVADQQLVTENLGVEQAGGVERHSAGHRIGLLYDPKRVVSGVDLDTAVPMSVGADNYAVFSAMLIHGNAVNRGAHIRFSVDFRAIASRWVSESSPHFASGSPYFMPVNLLS